METTWERQIDTFKLIKDKVLNNLVEIATSYTNVDELNDIIMLVELAEGVLRSKDEFLEYQAETIKKLERSLINYKSLIERDMIASSNSLDVLLEKAVKDGNMTKNITAKYCKKVDEITDTYKKPSEHEMKIRNITYKSYNKIL